MKLRDIIYLYVCIFHQVISYLKEQEIKNKYSFSLNPFLAYCVYNIIVYDVHSTEKKIKEVSSFLSSVEQLSYAAGYSANCFTYKENIVPLSSYLQSGVRDTHGCNGKCKGSVQKLQKKGNVAFTVLIEEGLAKQVEFKLDTESKIDI